MFQQQSHDICMHVWLNPYPLGLSGMITILCDIFPLKMKNEHKIVKGMFVTFTIVFCCKGYLPKRLTTRSASFGSLFVWIWIACMHVE